MFIMEDRYKVWTIFQDPVEGKVDKGIHQAIPWIVFIGFANAWQPDSDLMELVPVVQRADSDE